MPSSHFCLMLHVLSKIHFNCSVVVVMTHSRHYPRLTMQDSMSLEISRWHVAVPAIWVAHLLLEQPGQCNQHQSGG